VDALVERGTVTDATTVTRAVGGPLAHPVRLGTIVLEGGGAIVARLEDGCAPGQAVRLSSDGGVPVARPQ
jgi:hypothetical protein